MVDAVIGPLRGIPATSSVIFCHGLGDTSDGWAANIRHSLSPKLPSTRFILPTARTQPVTVNGGMPMPSWYDIKSLSRSRAAEECEGLDESAARLNALVLKEIEAGIEPKHVLLAGFSQGGALALWTALNYTGSVPLGGAFVLSGYLPRAHAVKPSVSVAHSLRVRLFHGDDDNVVNPEYAKDTLSKLRELGVNDLRLRTYAGLGHESNSIEMADFAQELMALLLPPPTADEIRAMSAKSLKGFLNDMGIDRGRISACVEKHELVDLALEISKTKV
jgi:lysophospholipase-2